MAKKTEGANTHRTQMRNQSVILELHKIRIQEIQMTAKGHSGSLQRGQAEENMFLRASEALEGPPLGGHWRIQNRPECIIKGLCRPLRLRKRFFEDFGMPESVFFKAAKG